MTLWKYQIRQRGGPANWPGGFSPEWRDSVKLYATPEDAQADAARRMYSGAWMAYEYRVKSSETPRS